jgi:hypothetical protein
MPSFQAVKAACMFLLSPGIMQAMKMNVLEAMLLLSH